jgi:hypothetical protein
MEKSVPNAPDIFTVKDARILKINLKKLLASYVNSLFMINRML